MTEQKEGCVKPARGPITAPAGAAESQAVSPKEVQMTQARVGKEAIDFEANAYVESEGFKTVQLSQLKGKWIVLCFYPGDFTFV